MRRHVQLRLLRITYHGDSIGRDIRYGPGRKDYTESVWRIYTEGIKKEKNGATIILWTITVVLALAVSMIVQWNPTTVVRAAVLQAFHTNARPADSVEVQFSLRDKNLFLAILEEETDWWESLYVGHFTNKKICWLSMPEPPTEQSILSARFIELHGISNPVLEVYGQTHMGYGAFWLYEIKDDQVLLRMHSPAVDIQRETAFRPGNKERYGYLGCGEVYQGGTLNADYKDQNDDGFADVMLTGIKEISCEENIVSTERTALTRIVKVAEIPVHRVYYLTKEQ
jgi:hypothetical protein